MTKISDIHVLAIAVRIFAIFLLVKALISTTDLVFALTQQSWMNFSIKYLIYPIITLLTAIVLLLFPLSVAKGIVPYKVEKEVKDVLPTQHLLCVAIMVLAMYFLLDALVNLFYWVFLWVNYFTTEIKQIVTLEQKGGTIATVAELFLSLILLLYSKRISIFLFKQQQ